MKLVEGGEEGGKWGEGGMREEQEERKKEGNDGHSTKDKGIQHLSWEEKSVPSICRTQCTLLLAHTLSRKQVERRQGLGLPSHHWATRGS